MLLATVNQPVLLSILAADGKVGLYARAQIYDSSGGFVTSVSLPAVSGGLYQSNYTPATEGYFSVLYQLFLDAGFTQDAGYEFQAEALDVSSFRTNILRLLGLLHENSVVDLQTYDGDGNLLTARIRAYDNATDATAAAAASPATYNTGKLFEWDVTATYTTGNLSKYDILRVL